jgi:peptidoglycan hydrolase-like protein with peptidoglycan-binding domain
MVKSLEGLNPFVKAQAQKLLVNANKRLTNYKMIITEAYRSKAEQDKLFAQGRSTPGDRVTNARGGQSMHNYGLAIDFALATPDGKKAVWDTQSDFDRDGKADWMEVVEEAKKLGFSWGGDWRGFVDNPHFQMTDGLSLSDKQIIAGKRPTFTAAVPKASVHPEVRAYQQDLVFRGYSVGKAGADGVPGNDTKSAIKTFQADKKLVSDGIAGPVILTTLAKAVAAKKAPNAAPATLIPYPGKVIKKGAKGINVERIQRASGMSEQLIDGDFGSKTERWVRDYQKRKGLKVDGQVGPTTWNMMF